MTSISFEATGTIWNIQFFEPINEQVITEAVMNCVIQYDLIFSRFNKLSQLYHLNQKKVLQNPSEELVQSLKLGMEMKALTQGLFDPFIGRKLIKSGYGSSELPTELSASDKHSKDKIIFHHNSIEISENALLDLGSFAKGLIVDKVSNELKKLSVRYFIINAGGDILLTSNQEEPVRLYIEDAITKKLSTQISLKNQALCSSSNEKRTWFYNGKKQQHIQNISKAHSIVGVSVTHSSCMIADLLTSVLFLTGQKYSVELNERFGVFEYIIQYK
jgi:thiamine biosynthesis lipoprotein ApbE